MEGMMVVTPPGARAVRGGARRIAGPGVHVLPAWGGGTHTRHTTWHDTHRGWRGSYRVTQQRGGGRRDSAVTKQLPGVGGTRCVSPPPPTERPRFSHGVRQEPAKASSPGRVLRSTPTPRVGPRLALPRLSAGAARGAQESPDFPLPPGWGSAPPAGAVNPPELAGCSRARCHGVPGSLPAFVPARSGHMTGNRAGSCLPPLPAGAALPGSRPAPAHHQHPHPHGVTSASLGVPLGLPVPQLPRCHKDKKSLVPANGCKVRFRALSPQETATFRPSPALASSSPKSSPKGRRQGHPRSQGSCLFTTEPRVALGKLWEREGDLPLPEETIPGDGGNWFREGRGCRSPLEVP